MIFGLASNRHLKSVPNTLLEAGLHDLIKVYRYIVNTVADVAKKVL